MTDSNSPSQKLRLLYIADILTKKSDENHPLNSTQIVNILKDEYNIVCERKAVYDSIDCLLEYGYDIVRSQKPRGYFLASGLFELAELRLLIDAVQAADFISAKKTKQLLKKFSAFTSEYQYGRIIKQIYVDSRNKCSNESLFYIIDTLNSAIISKKQVIVSYRRRKTSESEGTFYETKKLTVNPYALIWADDHYYLVGNYSKYDNLLHLRIDRIKSVEITEIPARNCAEVSPYQSGFDAADYAARHISMFSGDIKPVELICKNELLEAVTDRFGEKCNMRSFDGEHFLVKVSTAVTEGLISWVMQYGDGIKVRSPKVLKDRIIDKTNAILALYSG